jgi:hypothetical protein
VLLGAIVKVPLQALPPRIAGVDDPPPSRSQGPELGAKLGLESLVLEPEPCDRHDLVDLSGLAKDVPVMLDHRDHDAAAQHGRRRPTRRGIQLDGPPRWIDERPTGEWEQQLQFRVAQMRGEVIAQRPDRQRGS